MSRVGFGSGRAVRFRFVRARRHRRARLLVLLLGALGIVLGVLLPRIDGGATVPTARAAEVLGALGFGILGLVTVIYSLLFLVVQSSNTTFTPRLNLFQDDPWIWRTYALALGLFAFSTAAFLEMAGVTEVTVAVPLLAFGVALVVLGLMWSIQAKAFDALRMNSTLDRLQTGGREVIDGLYPRRSVPGTSRSETPLAPTNGRPVLWHGPQTTLQQLELRRLLRAAERADAHVVFRVGVGQTLWPGAAVAEVTGNVDDDAVVSSCVTGVNRTFDQDPLLAFRLLADIGIRAMSPAVNDPATAVQVLDAVVGLLLDLAQRDLAVGAVAGPGGATRVHLDLPDWADYVGEGLDELLLTAKNSPLVLERGLTTVTRLAEQVPADRLPEVAGVLQRLHAYLRALRVEADKPQPTV
ncbi:MAG: DUF2254 domain-containing protein [Pseudonocardiaceae bacterium]|nr:MAG: DUF2254 domain-containing protein [Pseudonocardiaceae bacterium]